MYKTWAFSWEPEVTDAFFTTSCSQHNKSGRRNRLKKWKAIFILILRRKKDLSTSCSNFMWGRVHLEELQTSCLKVFIPNSFLIKKMYKLLLQTSFLIWQDEIIVLLILYQPLLLLLLMRELLFSIHEKIQDILSCTQVSHNKFLITFFEKKISNLLIQQDAPCWAMEALLALWDAPSIHQISAANGQLQWSLQCRSVQK